MKTRMPFLFIVLFYSCLTLAQENAIIHVDYHGEQTEVKDIDFDQDSIADLIIATRIGNYLGPNALALHTGTGWQDFGWRFCIRSNYGDLISAATEWGSHSYHEYMSQGAIHEDFLTIIRRELSDGSYCYGWLSYRVDAGDWVPDFGYDIGIITFYESYFCTIPNYPFHVGQTGLDWSTSEDTSDLSNIGIYPNPTTGSCSLTSENISHVEAYNSLGQCIINLEASKGKTTIDLSSQPAGIYFVNVTDNNGKRCVKKVAKQ